MVSKDQNKKEIRCDSKTGFENFEDYFDSDADNTTLNSQNSTTVPDSTEDNGNKLCFVFKYLFKKLGWVLVCTQGDELGVFIARNM